MAIKQDPRQPKKKGKYFQGKFTPKNYKKYRGNPTKIFYRSGYEFKYFSRLDLDKNVLEWSSEEIVIPYVSPKDGKVHRYFPDVWVKMIHKDGVIRTSIVEIKPKVQTARPVRGPKQKMQTYINEMITFQVNDAKWQAAKAYAAKRGWEFHVLSERELGIKT